MNFDFSSHFKTIIIVFIFVHHSVLKGRVLGVANNMADKKPALLDRRDSVPVIEDKELTDRVPVTFNCIAYCRDMTCLIRLIARFGSVWCRVQGEVAGQASRCQEVQREADRK